jgi:hypothetical protein
VSGRPDWLFIKLHCHGLDPREQAAMSGAAISNFLHDLLVSADDCNYQVHFVTAREMVNIILAACEGHDGDPGKYRDYRLKAIRSGGENVSDPFGTRPSDQAITGRA